MVELKSCVVPTASLTLGKEIRSIDKQLVSEDFTQESYERLMQNLYIGKINALQDNWILYKNGFIASEHSSKLTIRI